VQKQERHTPREKYCEKISSGPSFYVRHVATRISCVRIYESLCAALLCKLVKENPLRRTPAHLTPKRHRRHTLCWRSIQTLFGQTGGVRKCPITMLSGARLRSPRKKKTLWRTAFGARSQPALFVSLSLLFIILLLLLLLQFLQSKLTKHITGLVRRKPELVL